MKKNILRLLGMVLIGCSVFIAGCLQPSDPKLNSAGIRVKDMDASVVFYTQMLGMSVKYRVQTCEMKKVVLEYQDQEGAEIILMDYTEDSDPNILTNPHKIVFTVPDAYAVANTIISEGYTIAAYPAPQPALGNVVVGMAKDPDGYLIELIQNAALTTPAVSGIGLGVSNLAAATEFYVNVMGMSVLYPLSLPHMEEIILGYPHENGGPSFILMHWAEGYYKSYTDFPVTVGFHVTDPKATIEAIEDRGFEILVKPRPRRRFNPMAYGLAKDQDGNLLEIKQSVELKEKK